MNNTILHLKDIVNLFDKERNIPSFSCKGAIDIIIPVYNGFHFLKILLFTYSLIIASLLLFIVVLISVTNFHISVIFFFYNNFLCC